MSVHLMSAVAAAALVVASTSAHATLLANGGFETAAVTSSGAAGWQGASTVFGQRVVNPALARTGNAYMNLAVPSGFGGSVALQNSVADGGLPPLVPGSDLELNFYVAGDVGATGNMIFALRYLDGVGNILYSSGNQQVAPPALNPTTYQVVNFLPAQVPVGAVAAFIEFSAATGPNPIDVRIDDVSLTVIPEPVSLSVLGLAGMGLMRRRR
jgi:hypothetical protein